MAEGQPAMRVNRHRPPGTQWVARMAGDLADVLFIGAGMPARAADQALATLKR